MEIELSIDDHLLNNKPTHIIYDKYGYHPTLGDINLNDPNHQFLQSKGNEVVNDDDIWEADTSSSNKKAMSNDTSVESERKNSKNHQLAMYAPAPEKPTEQVSIDMDTTDKTAKVTDSGEYSTVINPPMSQKELEELANLSIFYDPPCSTCVRIPSIIEAYVSLVIRTIYQILIISTVLSFAWTLVWDVDRRFTQEISKLSDKALVCEAEYYTNHCNHGYSLPQEVKASCDQLYGCMTFDPETHNMYSKITSGLVAEILNEFLETISYDTIIKFLVIMVICMAIEIPYAQYIRLKMKGVF